MAARAWRAAASAWDEVASGALAFGAADAARVALESMGECLRRDDDPAGAAVALERAAALDPSGGAPTAVVRLVAVWAEVGRLDVAAAAGAAALERTADPFGRLLLADTLVSVHLSRGDVVAAQAAFDVLDGVATGSARVAAELRAGQLATVRGALPEAVAVLERVLRQVAGSPAGRAGVLAELATVDGFRGAHDQAAARWREVIAAATEAGRASLVWSARASLTRALAASGVPSLPGALDDGLSWARSRQLRPLEVELLAARGAATGAPEAWRLGEALARACGMRWWAGFCLASVAADHAERADAAALLAGHVPWSAGFAGGHGVRR